VAVLCVVDQVKQDGSKQLLRVLREHKTDLWVVAVICGAFSRLVDNDGASGTKR